MVASLPLHPKGHEFVKTLPARAQEVLFGGAGGFEGRFLRDGSAGLRIMMKRPNFQQLNRKKRWLEEKT
jgi:hypothetical protein